MLRKDLSTGHSKASMLRIGLREYATAVGLPKASRLPQSRRKPPLTLDQFLQRQRVLGLWREIVRATNHISSEDIRKEMKMFAREEFERYRNVEDATKIRYLVSTGKEQLQSMRRYVDEMGHK